MKAFVHIPAAPMRKSASDMEEMVNQVLFGEVLDVVEVYEKWSVVRCIQDGYEGWIDNKQYKLLTEAEYQEVLAWSIVVDEPWVSISVTTPLLCGGQAELVPMLIPMGSRLPENHRCSLGGMMIEHGIKSEPSPLITFDKAFKLLNAPYLWGGKTCMGIDCSGFTQVVFRIYGIELQRNASQQAQQGVSVESLADTERGDLLFFANSQGRIVHVGIKFGRDTVIHASGRVRIDKVDDTGIFNHEESRYTHRLHSIRRMM